MQAAYASGSGRFWGNTMSKIRRKALSLSVVGLLGLVGLAACGGGGDGATAVPKVQPVSDVQQPNILINIRAGFGPSSWVLLQYDDKNQVFNVFENRNPLSAPASGRRPDLGAITSDPNNWNSYARNTITVLGTTTVLALDNGSTPNTYTVAPQALSDFVSGNSNLAQTAWNEIAQK
jgi:hypothetical protein